VSPDAPPSSRPAHSPVCTQLGLRRPPHMNRWPKRQPGQQGLSDQARPCSPMLAPPLRAHNSFPTRPPPRSRYDAGSAAGRAKGPEIRLPCPPVGGGANAQRRADSSHACVPQPCDENPSDPDPGSRSPP
jgi:hypothetical protein